MPDATKPLPAPTIVVPANARSKRCSCGRVFYFVTTTKGKEMPVDCDVPAGHPPLRPVTDVTPAYEGKAGLGIPHHINCADVEKFRRGRTR